MTSEVAEDGHLTSQPCHDDLVDYEKYSRPQKSTFRFKSSSSERKYVSKDYHSTSRSDGRRRRHRHRSRRKRSENPPIYDETQLPDNSSSQCGLDPDAAFRESLFDAMADDEGAQFWEGVYGQPIPQLPPLKEGPTGELEKMTDEEYAAHVRAEMYKKTHQYLIEEKEMRNKAKKEKEKLMEQVRRETDESERFRREVEESLQRGRERKDRAQQASIWTKKWTEYEMSWAELGCGGAKIPWPVFHGEKADISKKEIETFFLNAPTEGKPQLADLAKTLKAERLRWHPDKMQQKLGGQDADEASMRAVTAVFQIVDQMWSEVRDGKSRE